MRKNNTKNKKFCILILAGKIKLENYNFELNEYLLNIGNSLVFEKIIKKLEIDQKTKIYIAVPKINNIFNKLLPFKNAKFIEVGFTNFVLDSIYNAIQQIKEKNISIIPITTIPDKILVTQNQCYFGKDLIPKENWSALDKSYKDNINFLYKSDSSTFGDLSYPFTGRIFGEKIHFENAIKNMSDKKKGDILSLVQILINEYKYKISYEKWFDIGHEATYIDSKLSSITSRFFNNLYFKESTNSIIKTSQDLFKLRNEYFFYKNLPKTIQNFFPYIYSIYEFNENFNSIEMEFIPYPNLAEIFLFRNIGPNAWIRIIKSIKRIYYSFYGEKVSSFQSSSSWMYTYKLSKRFDAISKYIKSSKSNYLKKFLKDGLYINNSFYVESLSKTVEKLYEFLSTYENCVQQYLGHGDLCFNNILVDRTSGVLKLIDPKANFDENHKVFGLVDPYYDLAKLMHSYKYLYDSIVNNLYSIEFNNNKVELFIYAPKEYSLVNCLFDQLLINKKIDREILRKITSSLFLSMLPLHIEDEKRMTCFAILGTMILQNIEFNIITIQI